jgi:hypothetical protein
MRSAIPFSQGLSPKARKATSATRRKKSTLRVREPEGSAARRARQRSRREGLAPRTSLTFSLPATT